MIFCSGDSLLAKNLRIGRENRTGLIVMADGATFSLDSIASFQQSDGKRFIVCGGTPFLQASSGRVNVFTRYVFNEHDTLSNVSVKRLSPFDFMQKLPDERLVQLTSGALLRFTSDQLLAHSDAGAFRYYQRRANVTIATGAALAAVGAVSMFIGAFTSDADRDYRRPYYILGGAAFGLGAGLLSVPLPYFASRAAHFRNAAINEYNSL